MNSVLNGAMNSKVFNHYIPVLATISMVATNHHALACLYFSGYSLAWFFRVREERKREQYLKELLDLNQLVTRRPCGEKRRIHRIIYGTGLSVEEFHHGLNQLAGMGATTTPPLKQCGNCKFYHGKNRIVCAVHPEGYEGDFCADFDEKPCIF